MPWIIMKTKLYTTPLLMHASMNVPPKWSLEDRPPWGKRAQSCGVTRCGLPTFAVSVGALVNTMGFNVGDSLLFGRRVKVLGRPRLGTG
ncbi:hypothetical protein M0R45_025356 [Rubus argutus]|uniref:Uncharacterized protein n=1 Tax=Rubus argutus TaxID=59490 RepID=A0AAW1WW50_RUBAR